MTLMHRRRALMAAQGSGTVHGTWEDLFRSIDTGTYSTEYAVGETLPLNLGAEGNLEMEIAGFDVDTLTSDNSAKAPVTLIAKQILSTTKRWNPTLSGDDDVGTGVIGGWENSELRAWLLSTVLPLIPQNVRSRIVSVKKVSHAVAADGSDVKNMVSNETLWIPSARECNYNNTWTENENFAGGYSTLNSNASRNRTNGVTRWWGRSAYSTSKNGVYSIAPNGSPATSLSGSAAVTNTWGVVLCFCVG